MNGTCHDSLLDTYCRQVRICTQIALKCMEWERDRRPTIVEIIDKLNAMEDEMGMFENLMVYAHFYLFVWKNFIKGIK